MMSTETTIRNLLSPSVTLMKVFLTAATLLCTDFIRRPFPIASCNPCPVINVVVPSGTDASCHQNNFAHKLSFQYCFVYICDTCLLLEGIILWWCPAKEGLCTLLPSQLANIKKKPRPQFPFMVQLLIIHSNPPQFLNILSYIFDLNLFSCYPPFPFCYPPFPSCYPFFDWRFFFATFTPSVSKPSLTVLGSLQYLLPLCFLRSSNNLPQWIMLLPYVCYWQSPCNVDLAFLVTWKPLQCQLQQCPSYHHTLLLQCTFYAVSHSIRIFDLLLHLTFIHLNALISFTVQSSITFKYSFNSMIFHLRPSLGCDLIFSILFVVFSGKTLALLNKLPIRSL